LLDLVRERWGSQLDFEPSGSDFHDVKYETKRPVGLVLERSLEWATVEQSNTAPGFASAAIPASSGSGGTRVPGGLPASEQLDGFWVRLLGHGFSVDGVQHAAHAGLGPAAA
jgi:hypothetical protein